MTFDDGPVHGPTEYNLNTLAQNGILASFFTIGLHVDQAPWLLVAEEEIGHLTLGHTYTHPDLRTLQPQQVYAEMADTEFAYVNAKVCRRPTIMRPPFGYINTEVRQIVHNMGYIATIWNLDTEDWQLAATQPNLVLSDFQTNFPALAPYGVLPLEHDVYQYTVDLVPTILSYVQATSYEFIQVDRCIWGPEYKRHPSYVRMNRLCSSPIVEWPEPTLLSPCPVCVRLCPGCVYVRARGAVCLSLLIPVPVCASLCLPLKFSCMSAVFQVVCELGRCCRRSSRLLFAHS